MKTADILSSLRAFVKAQPTQRSAADALGISPSYLQDILKGNRGIPDKVLGHLGLKRVVEKAS